MKLTEDTLKQHIKQVLAEQSRYPMKRSKDPGEQKRQRFEINAACYGWRREPVKPGDLGRPNRVWGDCIEKSLITKEEWRQARRLNWNDDLAGAQRILDGAAGEKDPEVPVEPPEETERRKPEYSKKWLEGFRPTGWHVPARRQEIIQFCRGKDLRRARRSGLEAYPDGKWVQTAEAHEVFCSDILLSLEKEEQYSENWSKGFRPLKATNPGARCL